MSASTTNTFVGVIGLPNPVAALGLLGVEPAWHDEMVAFGGAPVWAESDGSFVISGDVVLDNAAELRHELGCPSVEPLELMAALYRRHGAEVGRYALGMYAAAIWDAAEQRLILLRDGVGARTLYYAAADGATWWFASRLSALRRCPAVSREISVVALRAYLTCAFVPGDQTMWCGAYELRPGTRLTLPSGKIDNYWEPREGPWDPDEPIEAHAARLRPLLHDAVNVRLPASGAVGVYLSGGLDSSLVAALAARAAPGRVHTYAIHFGHQYPNELSFSDLVAGHCGTQHHVLELSAPVVREHLLETMAELDDPIGDPLTVPNLLLGRQAAKDTDVILNGEGGDPCFGGPKNGPMLLHALYGSEESRESAYLRSFEDCYDDLPRLLLPEVQEALKEVEPQESLWEPHLSVAGMEHYLNRLMYVNVRFKGADHILTKVNNLTTANGLLGRSPLFDRRVVEASFAIPPHFKVAGAVEKAVLKRAVADVVPDAILNRPKSGMMVPVQAWFRNELGPFARDMLLAPNARIARYLDRNTVREWLAYRGEMWPRHGRKLWLLLSLELWIRAHE